MVIKNPQKRRSRRNSKNSSMLNPSMNLEYSVISY